ncbi:hypothetical protein [Corynebacterium sp. CCM 9203]|uniref:hypothetical protein n=1 Tax=Corynebacterium sp. CCM 9203 TaxID=3057615 RepID=UPI00352375D0
MQRSFRGGVEPARYLHVRDSATLASHSVRTAANSFGYLLLYLKTVSRARTTRSSRRWAR